MQWWFQRLALFSQRSATFSQGSLPLSLFSNNSSIRTQLLPLMRYFPFRKCAASAMQSRDAHIAWGAKSFHRLYITSSRSRVHVIVTDKATIPNDTIHKRDIGNEIFKNNSIETIWRLRKISFSTISLNSNPESDWELFDAYAKVSRLLVHRCGHGECYSRRRGKIVIARPTGKSGKSERLTSVTFVKLRPASRATGWYV